MKEAISIMYEIEDPNHPFHSLNKTPDSVFLDEIIGKPNQKDVFFIKIMILYSFLVNYQNENIF